MGDFGKDSFPMSLGKHRIVYTHCHRSQVELGGQREGLGQEHIQAASASLGTQLQVTLVSDRCDSDRILPHLSPAQVIFQVC